MLVLSRKKRERIVIGKNIEVTVLEVYQNRVKLGIRAPRNVSIDREQILPRITKAISQQPNEFVAKETSSATYSSSINTIFVIP